MKVAKLTEGTFEKTVVSLKFYSSRPIVKFSSKSEWKEKPKHNCATPGRSFFKRVLNSMHGADRNETTTAAVSEALKGVARRQQQTGFDK